MKHETTSTHIPMTPSAKREIRDFARGLDATYSEAVMMLLQLQQRAGETALEAGMRLQKELGKGGKL